jgi:hypothetical protein
MFTIAHANQETERNSRAGNEGEPIYGLLVEGRRERGHRFLSEVWGRFGFAEREKRREGIDSLRESD